METNQNSYSQCGLGDQGGLYRLVETTFYDYKSEYFYNGAMSGGVIYCQNCVMYIEGSYFHENYAHRGGVVTLSQKANFTSQGNTFE